MIKLKGNIDYKFTWYRFSNKFWVKMFQIKLTTLNKRKPNCITETKFSTWNWWKENDTHAFNVL